jgi:hypothetical protein
VGRSASASLPSYDSFVRFLVVELDRRIPQRSCNICEHVLPLGVSITGLILQDTSSHWVFSDFCYIKTNASCACASCCCWICRVLITISVTFRHKGKSSSVAASEGKQSVV